LLYKEGFLPSFNFGLTQIGLGNHCPHTPNHVAASEALRLNWASRYLGPKVDMPARRVASVAPARHRNRKGGFFKSINTDLYAANRERRRQAERGKRENTMLITMMLLTKYFI